ncbi:hypothetical protein ACJX0J_034792, partial [Zea mays]
SHAQHTEKKDATQRRIVDDHVADFLIENGIPLLESWKEGYWEDKRIQHLFVYKHGRILDMMRGKIGGDLMEMKHQSAARLRWWLMKMSKIKKILLTGGDHMARQIGQPLDPTRTNKNKLSSNNYDMIGDILLV